jgi:glycopeptide antibiotics resistance protein
MAGKKAEKKRVYYRIKLFFTFSYFAILFYLVFFIGRRKIDYDHDINLIPIINSLYELKYIREIGLFNYLSNLFGNVLLFVPLPAVLDTYFKVYKFSTVILISILFSIIIESMQYIFKVGVADIDDVILNSMGACLGYFLIPFFRKNFGTSVS